jgi:hypothetical protein
MEQKNEFMMKSFRQSGLFAPAQYAEERLYHLCIELWSAVFPQL